MEVPQNGWFIMEIPLKWMIWGYPCFRKPAYGAGFPVEFARYRGFSWPLFVWPPWTLKIVTQRTGWLKDRQGSW